MGDVIEISDVVEDEKVVMCKLHIQLGGYEGYWHLTLIKDSHVAYITKDKG